MLKEAVVTLPMSGSSLVSSASTGPSGSAVQQSFQERGEFSKKLSVALDKPTQSESADNKKMEKTKTDDGEGTQPEKALQGLPFGLIWSPPVPELLVSALNTIKQKDAPNTDTVGAVGIQSSLQQYAGEIIEAGSVPAPQATIPGTVEKQEWIVNKSTNQLTSQVQPAETAVRGLVEKMTSAEANDVEHSAVSAATAKSVPAGSNPAAPANLFVAEQTVTNGSAQPVEEKPTEATPNLQFSVTQPNEPQRIVPVQVLVDAGTVKSSAVSTVTGSVEENPNEANMLSSNGVSATELEQQATADTENGSFKDSLGQFQRDPIQKTPKASDNDPDLVVAASFNNSPNAVDQVPVSAEAASQPRQELHDVASQIMDGMIASTDRLKSSQIIVTLRPEHLGEVTVKINVDGDKVTAAFHAASSEVRAILESSLPQLKQEMSQQGWNFDSSGVFDGMQGFLANHQQRQSQGQTQHISQSHRVKQDDYEGILAFTSNGRAQIMTSAAVDYRI